MLLRPHDPRTLHRLAVAEGSLPRLPTDNSTEGRGSCALAVALDKIIVTSRPWQTPHCYSKMLLPTLGSPTGIVTSGSLIVLAFLGGIQNKIITGEILTKNK